jgi:hypothetical protein
LYPGHCEETTLLSSLWLRSVIGKANSQLGTYLWKKHN